MSTLFDLGGRVALVTGGSRGIGLAMARALKEHGAEVVINGRDPGRLAEAGQANGMRTACFDVTDSAAVNAAVKALGRIDILVNNAGLTRRGRLVELSDEDWHTVLDADLTSAFYVSRACAPGMIERRQGKIINTCSVLSRLGRANNAPYGAAKGGLKILTQVMAAELAPHNIQVNGIAPGWIRTDLTQVLQEDATFSGWVTARTPAGRWGEPDDLAGATVFLASRGSDFVNGHVLPVDGGVVAVV